MVAAAPGAVLILYTLEQHFRESTEEIWGLVLISHTLLIKEGISHVSGELRLITGSLVLE